MKKAMSVLICVIMLFALISCDKEEANGYPWIDSDFSKYKSEETLTIYVWQLAPKHYSYTPIKGVPSEHSFDNIFKTKSYTAEEMKEKIKNSEYSEKNILVMPYQMMHSSYIADIWIVDKDGNPIADRNEYIAARRTDIGID